MKCDYVRIYNGIDQQGKQFESRDKCSSKNNLREIEFKHAEYREQNITCFLCDGHFMEVFGDIVENEQKINRDFLNAKFNYNKDFGLAKKYGEYFDSQTYREQNYPRVQRAYDKWNDLRKKRCRYEGCNIDLRTIKRVFIIRIYSHTGREWANYYFCSKEHWNKIKYRIGIELPDKQKTVKVQTLDDYAEKISDSQTF